MGKTIKKTLLTAYNYFDLGINKRYGIGYSDISDLRKFLNTQSISSDYLYNDQSEYLVSVRAYPFWMAKMFNSVGARGFFPIGPFPSSEVKTNGSLLEQQKPPVLLATHTFDRYYNNFMDFAPYTKITAYIPYIGFRALNVNEIMGKTIKCYCKIDFDNGVMSVWLEDGTEMIQCFDTQIGIEIGINRTNASDIARNMYLWGIQTVTGIGSLMLGAKSDKGTYANSVKMGGSVATGYIGANQHHVERGSVGVGMNELFNPTSIYLIIEREQPEFTDVSEYKKIYGLPCEQTLDLSNVTGFTQIESMNFNPNGEEIMDDEITEIENLLRTGVIL